MASFYCPQCGHENEYDASFCGRCGHAFGPNDESVTNSTNHPKPVIVDGQSLSTMQSSSGKMAHVGQELQQLWEGFYLIQESGRNGSLLWKLRDKHIKAYILQKKVEHVKERIEEVWFDAYVETHARQAQHLLQVEQQQLDFEFAQLAQQHNEQLGAQQFRIEQNQKDNELQREILRRRAAYENSETLADQRLMRKYDRLAQAIDHIEVLFLEGGRFDGIRDPHIKKELFFRLVNLAEREIFKSRDSDQGYANFVDELNNLI